MHRIACFVLFLFMGALFALIDAVTWLVFYAAGAVVWWVKSEWRLAGELTKPREDPEEGGP